MPSKSLMCHIPKYYKMIFKVTCRVKLIIKLVEVFSIID